MNKIILLTISFLILFAGIITPFAFAQTETTTPTGTKTTPSITPKATEEAEVEKIKDLVASKVATLKLVEKKGTIGTVKTTSNTEISITNYKGDAEKIDIDELTKFDSSSSDDFGISDIKKGDKISFVGLYNKETKRLLARFITKATNIPENIEGQVTEKNADDFTVTIVSDDGKKTVVNIETSTKTSNYEDEELVKSGFSKIEVGDRVVVVGFPDSKEVDQINAERIIRLVGIPPTSGMKKVAGSLSPTKAEDN